MLFTWRDPLRPFCPCTSARMRGGMPPPRSYSTWTVARLLDVSTTYWMPRLGRHHRSPHHHHQTNSQPSKPIVDGKGTAVLGGDSDDDSGGDGIEALLSFVPVPPARGSRVSSAASSRGLRDTGVSKRCFKTSSRCRKSRAEERPGQDAPKPGG